MELQKFSKENMVNEKTKVTKAYIIIEWIREKPYYEILYHEVGKNYDTIGFGSYCLDNVRQWKEEYLEIVEEECHTVERNML